MRCGRAERLQGKLAGSLQCPSHPLLQAGWLATHNSGGILGGRGGKALAKGRRETLAEACGLLEVAGGGAGVRRARGTSPHPQHGQPHPGEGGREGEGAQDWLQLL